jgi:hypothetical protein
LFIGCNKIKIYPLNDKLLFTFDFNFSQTQILEIDWKTYEITEKKFQISILEDFKNWLYITQHAQWKFDDKIANEYSIDSLTSKLSDSISAVLKTVV